MMPKWLWPGPFLPGAIIGGLLALGHAPFEQLWIVFPALVAFAYFWAANSRSVKHAALSGWIVGVFYFGITLSWIINPFLVDPEKHAWMAPFALILLPSGLALIWAAGFALARRFIAGPSSWALGLIWAECARAYLFTGFSWANFASFYVNTLISQVVPWIGALGLSVVLVVLVSKLAIASSKTGTLVAIGLMTVLTLLPKEAGILPEDGPLVRMVQPNAEQADKWDPEKAPIIYQRLLRATKADPIPDVVIWPESALPYLLEYAEPILQEVALSGRGAQIITGINRSEDKRFYNSLISVNPDGSVAQVYDKRHLVPFGEYIPFGEFFARFGIYGLAPSQGFGFVAGTSQKLIDIPKVGTAVPLICYEGLFPRLAKIQGDARFILLITNDAWFGPDAGPKQHLVQSQLRALEQGLPLVRVANTGVTALIDHNGHIVADLPMNESGHLDVILPPKLANAPLFSRYGEWPILIYILLSSARGVVGSKKNKIDHGDIYG